MLLLFCCVVVVFSSNHPDPERTRTKHQPTTHNNTQHRRRTHLIGTRRGRRNRIRVWCWSRLCVLSCCCSPGGVWCGWGVGWVQCGSSRSEERKGNDATTQRSTRVEASRGGGGVRDGELVLVGDRHLIGTSLPDVLSRLCRCCSSACVVVRVSSLFFFFFSFLCVSSRLVSSSVGRCASGARGDSMRSWRRKTSRCAAQPTQPLSAGRDPTSRKQHTKQKKNKQTNNNPNKQQTNPWKQQTNKQVHDE